jgi:hypothetical protein
MQSIYHRCVEENSGTGAKVMSPTNDPDLKDKLNLSELSQKYGL